jgi:hypothetical protein
MAKFDITPQAQDTPTYTGMSRGIDSSANTGLGNLFSGLAQVLDQGVKETDRNVQANIKQDIFDQTDTVNAEFGIDAATDLQSSATTELTAKSSPPGIEAAGRQLDSLQKAYEAGALKDSHYWARMNSVVRQLRGKYPGYRDEIDQMVSSTTGAKPANALRESLMSEWASDASAAKAQANKDQDFIIWANKEGYLPSDYFQREAAGQGYQPKEVMAYVASRTAEKAKVEQLQRQASLDSANNSLTKETISHMANTDFNQTVNVSLFDAQSSLGKTFAATTDLLKKAQSAAAAGNPLSSQEVAQGQAQVAQLETTLRAALQQKALKTWDGDPSNSYVAKMDKKELDDAMNSAMAPIQILKDGFDAKNATGAMNFLNTYLETQKNDATRDLLRDVPQLQAMQALTTAYGAGSAGAVMNSMPTVAAATDSAVMKYLATKPDQPLPDKIDTIKGHNGTADTYRGVIDGFKNTLVNPEVPEDYKRKAIDGMFRTDADSSLLKFDPDSRAEFLKQVAGPDVSKIMLDRKAAGDEEGWQKYQLWVAQGFNSVFAQNVQDLQYATINPQEYTVSYNAAQNTFNIQSAGLGKYDPTNNLPGGWGNPVLQSVKQLNDAIQVVAPIVTANNGETGKEVLSMLAKLGYDPSAERDGGFLWSLGQAVFGSMPKKDAVKALGDTSGPTS